VTTYTAGTVVTAGSTLQLQGPAATPVTMSGFTPVTFNTVTLSGGGIAHTILVDGDINTSTFTSGAPTTAGNNIIAGTSTSSSIKCSSFINNTGGVTGTSAKIIFIGTGTWSQNISAGGSYAINTDVSSSGTLTLASNISFAGGTLTYVTGGFNPSTFTLTLPLTSTLNTNGMTWNNVTIGSAGGAAQTITLNSNLNVSGSLTLGAGSTPFTINGSNIVVTGSLSVVGTNTPSFAGTSTVVLGGTGTWSQTSALSSFTLPVEINTPQTISLSGTLNKNGNLTYTTGNVNAGSSTLSWSGTLTSNSSSLVLNNLVCAAASVFTGSNGFDVNSLTVNAGVNTVWGAGLTYNVLQSFSSLDTQDLTTATSRILFAGTNNAVFAGTVATTTLTISSFTNGSGRLKVGDLIYTNGLSTPWTITSTGSAQGGTGTYTISPNQGSYAVSRTFVTSGSGATRPYVRLSTSATQNVLATNAIDVDSSQGQTIIVSPSQSNFTYYFLQNATNWNPPSIYRPVSYTWVS
jgi:hypothetical protein